MSPVAIATLRFLTAGGLFIAVLLLNRITNSKYQLLVHRKDLPNLVILALTGVTFFFIAQYTGIQMASASIASILVCLLSPILISIISTRVFDERLTRKQVLGIGVAAIGTFTVVAEGALSLQNDMTFFVGTLILLFTPILWTTYTLLGRKIMEKYSPFLVVAYVNTLGGLFLVPFSLVENSFHEILTPSFQEWSAILFLALTCSLLAYFIWFHVMKQVKAAVTSSFLFGEPLITAIFATIFIREEMTLFTALGGLLIFGGVYFVSRQ
jgi:drug/metabolite transporter (DMT)-like permease